MKLTKKIETEIKEVMDNYWNSYFSGDIDHWATYLVNDYRNIGGTEEEIWNSKKEILDYTHRIIDQMKGVSEIRNKQVQIIPYDPYIMVHELMDIFIKIEDEWTFYQKFRLSSLIQQQPEGWKVLHQHGSYPDSKTLEGEAFAFNTLQNENRKLQQAIKARTLELENRTRELEIEASLERVRTVAMGMKKPDDILDICKIMFTELQSLGFSEIRNTLINFWDDDSSSLIDYDYSDYTGGNKAKLSYSSHPVFEQFQKKIKNSEDAFAELVVTKDELESWKQRRRDSGEYEDPRLNNIHALYYYFYSIGVGAIGISTFSAITEEKLNVLKRFRNVFDFAYRRYADVSQAAAQARETQIELGLERVRARANAMQNSDELAELVSVVFKELTQLEFTLTSCIIWIHDHEHSSNTLWIASAEMNKPAQPLTVEPFNDGFFKSIIHAWKAKDPKWVYSLTGTDKKNFEKAFFKEVPNLPDALKKALKVPKQVVFSASFNNFGALEIVETEALTDEKFEILHRFGKVFDSSYTRFNDLLKAEAQTREAQIEVAVERVRAKALAMHRSEDLHSVVVALKKELMGLQIPDITAATIYLAQNDGSIRVLDLSDTAEDNDDKPQLKLDKIFRLEDTDPKLWIRRMWNRSENYFVLEADEDDFVRVVQWIRTGDPVGAEMAEKIIREKAIKKAWLPTVKLEKGVMNIDLLAPPALEIENILLKMGAGFDLAYKRFLDLQNAEAQTREAQIELGLERVRARAMAMQKSDELSELVDTVFKELTKLDFALTWCIINIIDESSMSNTVWAANPDINKPPASYHMLFEDYPFHHAMMKGWKERKTKQVYTLEGSEKKIYDDYLFSKTEFKRTPEAAQAASRAMEKYVVSFSFSNFGGLQTVGDEPLSDSNLDILERFGKVFDLTYTRFNDLLNAETQTREAQIEAALERVRSRSMGMQKSEELKEVIKIVYQQLTHLKINLDHAGFVVDYTPGGDWHFWIADEQDIPSKITHPYFESVWANQFNEAKEKGADLFATNLTFEEKNKFYKELLSYVPGLPEASKDFYLSCPGLAASTVLLENVGLYIENFSGTPYTEEENTTLMRFGKVFQQTYTRFLDLQKAEAQVREAQIENALEKVRSRTMAMQKSEELPEVANILFLQMQSLGIPAWSCGYNILAEDKKSSTCIMSSEGEIQVPFVLPLTEHWSLLPWYEAIQNNLDFFVYGQAGEGLVEHYKYLATVPGLEKVFQQFNDAGISLPANQINHLVRFTNGFLLFITYESVPHAHDIFKRFGKVFEQTYTRFLDLQKAEAQTREAKIETALEKVRSRTMAMQKSIELGDVATVLFKELNQLVENLWTCGFVLCEKNRGEDEWWLSTGDGFIPAFYLPNTGDATHANIYDAWKKEETYHTEQLDGEALEQHYDWLMNIPVSKNIFDEMNAAGKSLPTWQKLHCAYFSYGYLVMITQVLCPEEQLFKRFAQVFDQTYTRFLDLQKAEAQARESQIQLGLERVRARTMAMQNSDESGEVVAILFEELVRLDLILARCIIWIFDNDSLAARMWMANSEDKKIARSYFIKYLDHPYYNSILAGWKEKNQQWIYDLKGDDKKTIDRLLLNETELSQLPETVKQGILSSEETFVAGSFNNFGLIEASGPAKPTDEQLDILNRFGKVFDLSYTRFNDLKTAEAQTRQAHIETAMEKVRARALAMQKPEELVEVAEVLRKEMGLLGVEELETSSIYIHDEASGNTECWYAIKKIQDDETKLVTDHMIIKLQDTWVGRQMLEFYHSDKKQISIPMQGDNRKEWIHYCAKHSTVFDGFYGEHIPDRTYHLNKFSNGYIGAASPGDISAESWELLQRATSVFSLAYTRFSDLQIAEASAREAVRRASLDRVRAEIASMRTMNDLQKITPLIWDELSILNIPFIRCGVFIMDESQKLIHTFLSTPDGKAIGAFHLPYTTPGNIQLVLNNWRQKKSYVDHWNEDAFIEFADILMKQGVLSSPDQYLSSIPHGGFHLHFLPFLQGMLYVGNTVQLGEDEIKLIQSVADAFSTAYARYEDFNKLEAAKEQIENTLTNLKQAQAQLVQSEKMASLGELTAGIAHEIQNPLNFVNNFSDVSTELIDEMNEEIANGNFEDAKLIAQDLKQNLEKINHHGKRAGDIVKGMLQHSRSSNSTVKEPTDINKLADEYLRLAYHGLRAKDKTFNATMKTDFDESIGTVQIIPQDIGRVILNLITNAFYAAPLPPEGGFLDPEHKHSPTVWVSTKKIGDKILISVRDNGPGIPKKILDKIFQPFFTTKPTGQGTGLGLSLSYDIVKAHGGEIKVNTKENEGTQFVIQLPA